MDGTALVYCEGAFRTSNGKTAHGLVRRTDRYKVLGVIDSTCAGSDAGLLLDRVRNGIPVFESLKAALAEAPEPVRYLVVGLAPDGGRFKAKDWEVLIEAVSLGINVDSGLHDFVSEHEEAAKAALKSGARIRDIRKPPPRDKLHFFSGKIGEVTSRKIALLGTDSAVGKRTTAWKLVDGIRSAGMSAELIGTGQTAWMQGARYSILMDSLANDFVSGEIEHAVHSCWLEVNPDFIVIEGQGSLMNPAYPGGFEILAGGRPDAIILQHAPRRKFYDGFPGYPIQPLSVQIQAMELVSGKPVVAVALNHEGLSIADLPAVEDSISSSVGIPVCDVLVDGPEALVKAVMGHAQGSR